MNFVCKWHSNRGKGCYFFILKTFNTNANNLHWADDSQNTISENKLSRVLSSFRHWTFNSINFHRCFRNTWLSRILEQNGVNYRGLNPLFIEFYCWLNTSSSISKDMTINWSLSPSLILCPFMTVFNVRGQTWKVLADQRAAPGPGSNHNFVIKSDKGLNVWRVYMTLFRMNERNTDSWRW